MPIPEDVRRKVVASFGQNPEEFDIDEGYNLVPRAPKEQPVASSTIPESLPSAKPSKHTVSGTVVRNAATSVIPSGVGLGVGSLIGGAVTGAITGAEAGSVVPGWGNIIGGGAGLLAGLGSTYLAGKAQQKILEQSQPGQEFLQNTAEANVENPKAAVVGNLAGSLPFLKPDLRMGKDAVMQLLHGNGIANKIFNPAGTQMLLGAGIGAGQTAYDAATQDEPIDKGAAVLNILGNALMSPRGHALNAKMGVHPYEPMAVTRLREEGIPAVNLDEATQPEIKPASGVDFARKSRAPRGTITPNGEIKWKTEPDVILEQGRKFENQQDAKYGRVQDEDLARLEGEGGVAPGVTKEVDENHYRNFLDLAEEAARTEKLDKLQADFDAQQAATLKAKNDARWEEMQARYGATRGEQEAKGPDYNAMQVEDLQGALRSNQIPTAKPAEVNPQRTFTKNVEKANTEVASTSDLAERRAEGLGDKYQTGEQTETTGEVPVAKPRSQLTENLKLKEALHGRNAALAKQKDVVLTKQETPLVTTPSGKEVRGFAIPSERKVTVGNQRADTGFHELTHIEVADLPAKEQARYKSIAEKDKAVQEWIAKQKEKGIDVDAEEYLVQAAGEDDARRILSKDSNLLRDITAWYKSKHSSKATKEDVVRYLGNKTNYSGGRSGGVVSTGAGIKEQPAEVKTTSEASPFENIRREALGEDYKAKTPEEKARDNKSFGESDYAPERNRSVVKHQEGEQGDTTEVRYKGYQKGVPGKVPGFSLYDLHENGKFTSTVREETAAQRGIKIPEYVKGEAEYKKAVAEHGVESSEAGEALKSWNAARDKQGVEEASKRGLEYQDKEQDDTSSKPEKQQHPEVDATDIDTSRKGFLRPLQATFDAVETVSKPLAQAFRNWETRRDQYLGARNVTLDKLNKFSEEDLANTMAYHRAKFRGLEPSTPVTEEASSILKEYFKGIREKQIESGLEINGRKAGMNEWYVPDMMSDNAIHLLSNRGNSPEALAIRNEWAKYITDESKGKIKLDEAKELISEYSRALGKPRDSYRSINFGALRKAQGFGLPEGLRETDPLRAIHKYGKRAAADLAMYQELENKPEIASKLGLRNPKTDEMSKATDTIDADELKQAMKWVMNNFESSKHPQVAAVTRAVNNALLGAGTGLRDIVSVPVNSLPYVNKFSDLSVFWKGMQNWRQNSVESLRTAARQPNMDKVQWGDVLESPDRFSATVNKVADGLRKWQGRELLENASRIYTYGIGKELAINKIAAGDIKWLEKFGTLAKSEDGQWDAEQIAKNFVDKVQGTYGGRGLPTGVMEGSFAPFITLQKWGIEKSNVIYKDVVKPALAGENYVPLLTYTLGSILTGAGIQEMNKLLSNRKGQDATIRETAAIPSTENVAAELATLMQLGSFAGIVGDSLKAASDVGLKGQTPKNIVSFPTATFAAELGSRTADVAEALRQGENPWETLKSFVMDTLTSHVQTARLIANHTWNKDDAERAEKFRDMRVFQQLSGEPTADANAAEAQNKYLNPEVRKFKRAGDMESAIALVPEILEKFADKAGKDPIKALDFLAGVKKNNYQTAPNPDKYPLEFQRYWNFLRDSQGEEKAYNTIVNYFQQKGINEAKSRMIP